MKHLLKMGDLSPEEILHVLDVADTLKKLDVEDFFHKLNTLQNIIDAVTQEESAASSASAAGTSQQPAQ